jgi:hypothetical protein
MNINDEFDEDLITDLENVKAIWRRWLRQSKGHIMGPGQLKRVGQQGDWLIEQDLDRWAEQPLPLLYEAALDRVDSLGKFI